MKGIRVSFFVNLVSSRSYKVFIALQGQHGDLASGEVRGTRCGLPFPKFESTEIRKTQQICVFFGKVEKIFIPRALFFKIKWLKMGARVCVDA